MEKENLHLIERCRSKKIVIGEMFHDVLNTAMQNVAQTVYGVDFNIFVVAQAVDLCAVDVVVGVKIILGNATLLHGCPQTIILDQNFPPPSCFFTIIAVKSVLR